MHQHWFLLVVPRTPAAMLIAGVLSTTILGLFFAYLLGAFSDPGPTLFGVSLFFATLITYSTIAAAYVIRRSVDAFEELRSVLDCDDRTFRDIKDSIHKINPASAAGYLLIGLILGIAHNVLLVAGSDLVAPGPSSAIGGYVGTTLAWLVLTYIVATLIRNAEIYARLGADMLRIDLLNPHSLYPFGRLAVLPTLGLIGTQALYPLLSLEGDFNAYGTVPGFLVTTGSLIYFFLRSTLPAHRRIAAVKHAAILETQNHVDSNRGNIDKVQPFLDHREYLDRLSEWPFKVSSAARWALYLLIPPMTWVGAALIENVVDALIS